MAPRSQLKLALNAQQGVDVKKRLEKRRLKERQRLKQKKHGRKGGILELDAGDGGDGDGEEAGEERVDGDDLDAGDAVLVGDEDESEVDDDDDDDDDDEVRPLDIEAIDDTSSSAGSDISDAESIPLSDISLADGDDSDDADVIPHQRLTINNGPALLAALARIAQPSHSSDAQIPFSATQAHTTPADSTAAHAIPDISDDLQRELAFYAQALDAATTGRRQLLREGVRFTRPADYFAEMVKPDEQMERVRARLVQDAAGKRAAADARRQRDLKKFGKQVQVEKMRERDREKRTMLDKVKSLKRKRAGDSDALATNEADDLFDVAIDNELSSQRRGGGGSNSNTSSTKKPSRSAHPGYDRTGPGAGPGKRQKRDAKFGHGGKKRFGKSGDAQSSADLSGFSVGRMKGGGRPAPRNAAKARPGKARRAGAKR